MRRTKPHIASILMFVLIVSASLAGGQTTVSRSESGSIDSQLTNLLAQAQELARKKKNKPITTAAASQVVGSGTSGRISKWSGVSGSNTYVLGDSNIFEDKFGKVGIGTMTPTSLLTVQGMIEITLGGLKFPDGTLQTTAAISSVFHDATLMGNGTSGSPLGVAVPLVLNGAGGLAVIQVTNTGGNGGDAVAAIGSDSDGVGESGEGGGEGVVAFGGNSNSGRGGRAVRAIAGGSNGAFGGDGVLAFGGNSNSNTGGRGVFAAGGDSSTGDGGRGVLAGGGNSGSGNGGHGLVAGGGTGTGAGKTGGIGIEATGGEGLSGATAGLAGKFDGNVQVTGTLSKGGGSFKIDHPLDPENRYLYHSFVESPDMMNIYNGNITTNENGEATVTLPGYFDALNKDFRYQLTVIGTFAQAIVANEVLGNRFVIKTNAPNVKVSWQVTGIRSDAFANKNRIPVEVDKPDVERGYYLHHEAFDQPEEKSINWASDPEMMKQRKQRRLAAEQTQKQQQNQR